MYPANFNLYRCSRGIKEPVVFKEIEKEVQKIIEVSRAGLTFEKTVSISNTDTEFENILNYRYYNLIADCFQALN